MTDTTPIPGASKAPSANFVGDSSLLVRCAEVALNAGWSIGTIVTDDNHVAAWARAAGLAVLTHEQAATSWDAIGADYLFSVGNPRMLSEAALANARRLALNFHDGPLPQCAGLNAASWALLKGAERHGVAWHEMTTVPNAGRIAEACEIPIDPHDVAFSLNAKCYEAGAATFEQIIWRINSDALNLSEQVGERHYFGRLMRPKAAAVLDFTLSSESILSVVRGLDTGPYPNPLGYAKLLCDRGPFLVGKAEAVPSDGHAQPGTIVSAGADELTLATAHGHVRLSELMDCEGALVVPSANFAPGDKVHPLGAALANALDEVSRKAARSEEFWARELFTARAVELPLPRSRAGGNFVARLGRAASPTAVIAAIVAWVTRLTGATEVSLGYHDAASDAELGAAASLFQAWHPLTIACERGITLGALVGRIEGQLARVEREGPIACDLHLRFGRNRRVDPAARRLPIALHVGAPGQIPSVPFADLLIVVDPVSGSCEVRNLAFMQGTEDAIAQQLDRAVAAVGARNTCGDGLETLAFTSADDAHVLSLIGGGAAIPAMSIAEAVRVQAQATPDRVALKTRWEELTFAELQCKVDRAAATLAAAGVGAGDIVGVCMGRTCNLVVALLAVLRAGAAYLPLDPKFPSNRLQYMLADSDASTLIVDAATIQCVVKSPARIMPISELVGEALDQNSIWSAPSVAASDLAYLMYTSGSTGRPKGVMISHAMVANFFVGMDARIGYDPPGVWLAVTSPSFDISVLELFWTLSRGFTVALHSDAAPASIARPAVDFSLFYFAAAAAEQADPYRLLFEGAKFADANGFHAVWMPERHFHDFGGPYPNPAITAAAIAAQTKCVRIRAGSCVLPLHNPIRVAEDWSVIDVMSNGRVGLAMASGWQPTDFVLMPDAFKDRKAIMLARIEQVRALWRGQTLSFPGPDGKPLDIRTLPRPVQSELPLWLTAAGNPETFAAAGRLGCNVLTHMLGMSLRQVSDSVRSYRAAWSAAGHPGRGSVTLMLHTFVGSDDERVRDVVREPMKRYLASAVDLVRDASWTFPVFVQTGRESGKTPVEVFEANPITPEEMDALLEHAFNRYFETSGLFGSPETCLAMVAKVAAIGVDEIACLIDFGVAADSVLAHLEDLNGLRERALKDIQGETVFTVAEDIIHFGATHLQCTPSMAAMVTADPLARSALGRLKALMVGGEALSLQLARELRELLGEGRLLNMYGPTETTIWSTVSSIDRVDDFIGLGEPIVNTTLRVCAPNGRPLPPLAAGELWIGGAGLAKGYWRRDDLTQARFVTDDVGQRMYRTGDLVRQHVDGRLEFLGRIDHQVKIRGHRIELGEIEAALEEMLGSGRAVVVAREMGQGDKRLVAYIVEGASGTIAVESVRAKLAERLPEIMIPSMFVPLSALPMTPNGKIDRNALPAATARVDAALPVDVKEGLEATIAAIWCELLGVDHVSATQNFFDLGGHSLLAVQTQRRLRTILEREVSVTDIFRFPTVRALARFLEGQKGESASGQGRDRARARLSALRRVRAPVQGVENG